MSAYLSLYPVSLTPGRNRLVSIIHKGRSIGLATSKRFHANTPTTPNLYCPPQLTAIIVAGLAGFYDDANLAVSFYNPLVNRSLAW